MKTKSSEEQDNSSQNPTTDLNGTQQVQFVSDEIEAHNLNPASHPFLLEKIRTSTGGTYYLRDYEQPGYTLADTIEDAINAIPNSGGELDCSYYEGIYTITRSINISKPIHFKFGNITLRFDNSPGENMFNILSNNIAIRGVGRVNRKADISPGVGTTFEMLNIDSTLEGYHVKGRGTSGVILEGFNLVGIRTTRGRQYGSTNYPIDGVGGIYFEKQNPGEITPGNTVNNLIIERVLIVGTKSHGIYVDTPILSKFEDVRISDAGGHGIFIWNGTTILFQSVYVSGANNAGIVWYRVSYSTAINTVSENNTLGWWIRSCFSVNLFVPAVEALYTQGRNPWKHVQPETGRYGMGLSTYGEDGVKEVIISDVSSDYQDKFIGIPLLITGGRSVNVFSMYAFRCSIPGLRTEAYDNMPISATTYFRWIGVYGNARDFYIQYPHFVKDTVELINRADIDISTEGGDGILLWNPATGTTLTDREDWDKTTLITNSGSVTAPIFLSDTVAGNVKIQSGNTEYTGNKNPLIFTGGLNGTYDGSEEMVVNIPTSLPADGGNADTLKGYTVDFSSEPNTIVLRDKNGNISGWIDNANFASESGYADRSRTLQGKIPDDFASQYTPWTGGFNGGGFTEYRSNYIDTANSFIRYRYNNTHLELYGRIILTQNNVKWYEIRLTGSGHLLTDIFPKLPYAIPVEIHSDNNVDDVQIVAGHIYRNGNILVLYTRNVLPHKEENRFIIRWPFYVGS